MKSTSLLFNGEYLLFIWRFYFLNVNLLNFIPLLYTQFLKKLSLTLQLVYDISIVFYLLIVFLYVRFNPRDYIGGLWSYLFPKLIPLSRMIIVLVVIQLFVVIIIFRLNTICMIHFLLIYKSPQSFINGLKSLFIPILCIHILEISFFKLYLTFLIRPKKDIEKWVNFYEVSKIFFS